MSTHAISEIEAFATGDFIRLRSVDDLAQFLMKQFPKDHNTFDYTTALMCCEDCLMDGDTTAAECREAFVVAAREAGIALLPDDLEAIELDWA